MATNSGKFTDRNPDILAAGKLVGSGDSTSDCFAVQHKDSVPPMIQKFYNTTRPEPGKERIHYGKADDSKIAYEITHGVNTRPSLVAGDLVNPSPKTAFRQTMEDKRESQYLSKKKAPLGKCHDQRPGLPEGVGLYDVAYGIPTLREGKAGDIINPPKSRKQVDVESGDGKDLYKVSHHAYDVAETYDRKYNWEKVPKTSTFGVETPHDNDGIHVKKSLKWLYDTQSAKAAHIVPKRLEEFRERTQPQLGKVHDPIKDTMNVPPDHTFGVLFKPDEFGAGDLIHGRTPDRYQKGSEHQRAVLAAIRQHLKKSNYHSFKDLKSAFLYYDKDKSGKISIDELQTICEYLRLPVEEELLHALILYCDVDGDRQIDYEEFCKFLNWENAFEDELEYNQKAWPKAQEKNKTEDGVELPDIHKTTRQIDKAVGGWKTSSSTINATVGRHNTQDWKSFGVPTIRSDLAAPRIRRISDRTNYGDESDAYGLINPSVYSNHGVHEKDFFQHRTPNEVHRVIDSVGIRMSPEMFDELWKKAASENPQGLVSVNSFKKAMDMHADERLHAPQLQEA
ncbi:EF-hand domain-containing family member B-like [Dendronephthya gigantea]|uniref:EF-hand domain-containing family member B-like n=1 Tax=Dendronephthya gigantea TaxID=151771 RepID=UPI00106DB2D9|nr:EF-hand domain-containing family member B-like [Dendronephthya gigantea]